MSTTNKLTTALIVVTVLASLLHLRLEWMRSPHLRYTVDEQVMAVASLWTGQMHMRLVTVEVVNVGGAPSENVSGWVKFPEGEQPRLANGPEEFDVKVGGAWKRLGRRTGLRRSQSRTDTRAQRLQPGYRYTLKFVAVADEPPSPGDSAEVHLVDDTGAARRR